MYDSTKLSVAIDSWLQARCSVGYGEVYSGDLLADFEQYIRETKALKATPGMVAFGRQMNERDFGRRRIAGLTYWTGLELKDQRVQAEPRRHQRTIERIRQVENSRVRLDNEARREVKIEDDEDFERVRAAMEKETRERIASAGLVDESDIT